jgi:tetratricopeptide (TPR) repeat protein
MGASYEDIKASYRRLARIYHPDSNPENQQQAKEKFIQLTDAYRQLISIIQPPADGVDSPTVNLTQRSSPSQPPQVKVSVKPKSPPLQNSPELSPTDRKLKRDAYIQLQQMLKEQRFPRAIALVEGLSQRLPEDPEVRQWQAITYQRFARYLIQTQQGEKARIYLKKALRTDPHNKSLWQEVNRDFLRLEQLDLF